jgi:hypothetical protein
MLAGFPIGLQEKYTKVLPFTNFRFFAYSFVFHWFKKIVF